MLKFEVLRPLLWDVIVFFGSVLPLLVTADVPSSPIVVTMMMAAIHSSEASVVTRATP
jgi:hypothetical protein